ncbi:hypothetical protein AURDEDRAFT_156240 [Auricularia subglabra TFB-10046 SS5]|nr:hypothetical protein AURDEDRAFT_156240 [Auricularia subglabra TFB-10046 SS5]
MDAAPVSNATIPAIPIDPRAVPTFILVSFILQLYDWCITLDKEVERIWLLNRSPFTLFWVVVRYFPILGRVLAVIAVMVEGAVSHNILELLLTPLRCERYASVTPIILGFSLSLAHLVLFLRIYALWDRKVLPSALPAVFWLAELGMNFVPVVDQSLNKPIPGTPGCAAAVGPRQTKILTINISFGVAFDITVTALLVLRCLSYWRRSMRGELLALLLVQGLGYFCVVLVLQVINLILLLRHTDLLVNLCFLMLATTVPNMIANRLVLDLRAFDTSRYPTSSTRQADESTGQGTIKLTLPFGLDTIVEAFEPPRRSPETEGTELQDMAAPQRAQQ